MNMLRKFTAAPWAVFFLSCNLTQGETFLYLGMTADTAPYTLLGKYDVSASTLTSVTNPFGLFSFLAMSPNGAFYAADGDELYTVNPTTGSAALVGILHEGTVAIESAGVTFKPDGTMLVHEYSNRTGSWLHKLFSGNPATGELTFLTDITGLSTGLYGIEYANGVLYGTYDNALYSINPATGVATLIGTGTSAWDMAFSEDGLFGTAPDGGLYQINTSTGASTLVRNFRTTDNKDPWGLAAAESPELDQQPFDAMILVGQSGSFSVQAVGTPPLSYQWQKQDNTNQWADVDGATEATLVFNPMAAADAGGYRCVVTSPYGSITSNRVMLNGGDANYDGKVGLQDLSLVGSNYGLTGQAWPQGDFNGDGLVGLQDLSILATNYGFGE